MYTDLGCLSIFDIVLPMMASKSSSWFWMMLVLDSGNAKVIA